MKFYQPNYCLLCDGEMTPTISWNNFFIHQEKKYACEKCERKLEKLAEPRCTICSRSLTNLNEKFQRENTCYDCIRWENSAEWQGTLTKNFSLFVYNEFLAEIIAQFKYRGDYEIAKIFSSSIRAILNTLIVDYIVPIPLSEERLQERGFNQAEALAAVANIETTALLTRIHSEKQSKKSREERMSLPQVFSLQKDSNLKGKTIVLLDDIYTTGSTIRQAAKLLKQAGAVEVFSITIGRG